MTKCLIAAAVVSVVACGSSQNQNAGGAQARPQAPMGTLEQLLAPIALYPDPLLAQILISAADPASVTELDKWLKANPNLKGTELQDAAVRAGFEPSFVALALFPQVVAKMAEQIAFTTLLGQTFTTDRNVVFDTIQRLRHQARDVGTLKTTPQQEVETRTTPAGSEVIVIEPANPQVVYVPQYNPQVVYTQPPSTTTVIVQEDDSSEEAIAAGLIGFTAGIAMGAAMDNHYYYSPYGWYGGAHMYNEAWEDYYDYREDAREDWMDHREDVIEERSDRVENRQEQVSDRRETAADRRETTGEQRTDRQQTRQENRPEAQGQRAAQRSAETPRAQSAAAQGQRNTAASSATAQTQRTTPAATPEARGTGQASRGQVATQRSGGSSDAFSGYSSGASQRSSSARGQQSRGASRGGGGGRRR